MGLAPHAGGGMRHQAHLMPDVLSPGDGINGDTGFFSFHQVKVIRFRLSMYYDVSRAR